MSLLTSDSHLVVYGSNKSISISRYYLALEADPVLASARLYECLELLQSVREILISSLTIKNITFFLNTRIFNQGLYIWLCICFCEFKKKSKA